MSHALRITRTDTSLHTANAGTAADALKQRVERLKARHIPYTLDGNTLTYAEHDDGAYRTAVELEYLEEK